MCEHNISVQLCEEPPFDGDFSVTVSFVPQACFALKRCWAQTIRYLVNK